MRKIFRVLLVCAAMTLSFSVEGRNVHGIRVEADKGNIIVYLDGVQISSPTRSCFIANLDSDYYYIEVYDAFRRHSDDSYDRGRLLYRKKLYYKGRGIEKIYVRKHDSGFDDDDFYDDYDDDYDDDYRRPGSGHGHDQGYYQIMPSSVFNDFYRTVRREPFFSGKERIVASALRTSFFTSRQCRKLLGLFGFDSEKVKIIMMMYPNVVDKEHFFIVLDELSFISSRNEVIRFLEKSGMHR